MRFCILQFICARHPMYCVCVRAFVSAFGASAFESAMQADAERQREKSYGFRYAYASSLCEKYLTTKNIRRATYAPVQSHIWPRLRFGRSTAMQMQRRRGSGCSRGPLENTHQQMHTCKKRSKTSHGILQARRHTTGHATPVVQSPPSCVLRLAS